VFYLFNVFAWSMCVRKGDGEGMWPYFLALLPTIFVMIVV